MIDNNIPLTAARRAIGTVLYFFLFLGLFSLTPLSTAHAEMDGISLTVDNDLFIGDDSGYTNGVYLSIYDLGEGEEGKVEHDFWVAPLMWSLPEDDNPLTANSYMIGQTMSSPTDITVKNPDKDELPYSALLALTNTYLTVNADYADSVSTTIGIIGPAALGEEAQTFVHKVVGAKEPKGWDTQLHNELVFQFSRRRAWRTWVSSTGNTEVLTSGEVSLGTIQSSVGAGLYVRHGRNLQLTYASTLLNNSRTSNPLSVNGGWNLYAGLQGGYIFNWIFTDGNTFRDSRSIDYNHEYVGVTAGLSYSWKRASLTLALTDANLLNQGDRKTLENLSQFGTLTLAWQL